MNHFSPVCVAAWACVMPLMVQARDIVDYPVCLEIRTELLGHAPRYYTPKQVVEVVERCMTWEDNMRAKGIRKLSATQKPQEGPSTLFRVDLSL